MPRPDPSRPVRLAAFDVDGTLIEEIGYVWNHLHDAHGTDADERRRAHDAYFARTMTYEQWCEHDAALLRGKGATRASLERALGALRLMPGTRETLRALREAEVRLVVLSGSIDLALEHVLPDHAEYFEEVFLNRLRFAPDGALHSIEPTPYDIEHKATGLREISMRLGVPLEECAFVGDNYNDVEVARVAGVSIAFNCRSEALASVADHVVPGPDLRAVLPHLLPA